MRSEALLPPPKPQSSPLKWGFESVFEDDVKTIFLVGRGFTFCKVRVLGGVVVLADVFYPRFAFQRHTIPPGKAETKMRLPGVCLETFLKLLESPFLFFLFTFQ